MQLESWVAPSRYREKKFPWAKPYFQLSLRSAVHWASSLKCRESFPLGAMEMMLSQGDMVPSRQAIRDDPHMWIWTPPSPWRLTWQMPGSEEQGDSMRGTTLNHRSTSVSSRTLGTLLRTSRWKWTALPTVQLWQFTLLQALPLLSHFFHLPGITP